ncbi:MAG: shikimate kinase [Bacteroidales bacterium]
MIIALVGFMGAGKTTLGKKISEAMSAEFVDLDQYIEKKESKKIIDIFEKNGEMAFRKMEEDHLQDLLEAHISKHPEAISDLPEEGEETLVNYNDSEDARNNELPKRKCTLVISLGGGTVESALCRDLIRRFTYCIYLKADVKVLLDRLDKKAQKTRPKLEVPTENINKEEISLKARIESLYERREPLYEEVARKIIKIQ